MSQQPALAPPAGVTPDFIDPRTSMSYVITCFAICLPITTVMFALRTWTRAVIKRHWVFEDWFCAAAWVCFVVFAAFVLTLMMHHGGVHEWDLTETEAHSALFWSNGAMIVYAFAMLFTKLAIVMLYRRIFVTRRWTILDWVIKITIVVLVLFYVATTLAKIFSCTPRSKIWDSSVQGSCIPIAQVLVANGIFNVITDILILLIPVRSVWKLQLSTKKKLGVIAIFSVGLLAPAFSIVGLVMRLRYSGNADKTWDQVLVHLWAAAEVTTGLICVCAPDVAPIARRRKASQPSDHLYGDYNMRTPHSKLRDQSLSLDEVDAFVPDREKSQVYDPTAKLKAVPAKVVTGVQAMTHSNREDDFLHAPAHSEFANHNIGVTTTMEQEAYPV